MIILAEVWGYYTTRHICLIMIRLTGSLCGVRQVHAKIDRSRQLSTLARDRTAIRVDQIGDKAQIRHSDLPQSL